MIKNKSKNVLLIVLGLLTTVLLSACSAQSGNKTGFFQTYLVEPFSASIHGIATFFNGNYGIAIILITLIVRLALMPLMLRQYKNQQIMREKMNSLKPELDEIQKRLKATKDRNEQQKIQAEMMGLYRKHGVNPLNMGCLPILIQMPVLMGFYYAIRGSKEIASHSFLWFSLGHPDIWITAIAGVVYYLQFKVSMSNMPVSPMQTEQQQKMMGTQMKIMGLMSPLMIVMVSLNAPAALPLYWTVGGTFLIIQSLISKKLYQKPENNLNTEKA